MLWLTVLTLECPVIPFPVSPVDQLLVTPILPPRTAGANDPSQQPKGSLSLTGLLREIQGFALVQQQSHIARIPVKTPSVLPDQTNKSSKEPSQFPCKPVTFVVMLCSDVIDEVVMGIPEKFQGPKMFKWGI
ncbi:hypothetical protein FJTKL_11139 [Diaporthe vaccinii]|uniref:Uncharacterized protein n=1 Tax=Diaporthe vaccinii TaxID=105482 RepID=A0ABR4EI33_9PEZI